MKIVTPEHLSGKELFKHLHEHKATLIKQKKIGYKNAMPVGFAISDKAIKVDKAKALKMDDDGQGKAIIVEVIANLAGWMDYDNDVILKGAYSKSINDKGNDFPYLRDHEYSTDAIIAETLSVYVKDFGYSELALNGIGTAQGLVFKGRIEKEFSPTMYAKYKAGVIKQHSIGMRYVKIDLCFNDPDFEEEYKAWQMYIEQVINQEKAMSEDYFWAIKEIGLIENSAVVFGSNSITPMLSVEEEKSEAVVIDTSKVAIEAVKDTSNKSIFEFLKCL